MLAAAGFAGQVWIFDAATGRPLWRWNAPSEDVRALAFSPDGRGLAAAGRSGTIRVWDASTGKVRGDLEGHQRRVRALAYSPDGARLVSAGEEQSIRLWDVSRLGDLKTLPVRPGVVLSLAFCGPERVAAGGSDNVIRIWDLSTGTEQLRLLGHTGSVSALVWDTRAEVLVSGSFDTTVRFWPLRTNMDAISRR